MNIQERWIEPIDQITSDFTKSFGMLTVAELNWKPNANTWSIGQNIHHLIVINGTYHPLVKSVREKTYKLPFIAKLNFMVSFLGRTLLKGVQPDRKKKIKTFSIWEPAQSDIKEDVWEDFKKQQEELKILIQSCSDLLDKGTVISSPANKYIVYKLETAFDIIVTHERRHYEQAREVEKYRRG